MKAMALIGNRKNSRRRLSRLTLRDLTKGNVNEGKCIISLSR